MRSCNYWISVLYTQHLIKLPNKCLKALNNLNIDFSLHEAEPYIHFGMLLYHSEVAFGCSSAHIWQLCLLVWLRVWIMSLLLNKILLITSFVWPYEDQFYELHDLNLLSNEALECGRLILLCLEYSIILLLFLVCTVGYLCNGWMLRNTLSSLLNMLHIILSCGWCTWNFLIYNTPYYLKFVDWCLDKFYIVYSMHCDEVHLLVLDE